MGQSAKQKPLTKSERIRIAVAAVIAFFLLAAAAATWYFRDDLFVRDELVRTAEPQTAGYRYDPGITQHFAITGKLLAQVTGSGYSLLTDNGETLCSQSASFDAPSLDSCSRYAVFFDQGGSTLYFADTDGTVSQYDCGGEIYSVRCADSGHLALVTRQAGWRALVTVLDSSHSEVYRWYSAESYVLSARISPDGRTLATLCLDEQGSSVRFFSLTSEEQKAAFSVSDTVLTDFFWLGADKLCALSGQGAVFFSSGGNWIAAYDFQSQYLTAYDAGSSFLCLALSPYRSGSRASVVCLSAEGEELSSTEVEGEILSLDASGSEFLLLGNTTARLYGANGNRRGTLSDVAGFKQALIRSKGEALLLAAGFAEVYQF